jgi:hypothetical protein
MSPVIYGNECPCNDDLNDSRFSGQTAQKVIMSEHQWKME